ncbi:MAG TPA: DEAD/DEAH box helicase [Candidatus Dormibacteraeota bacterium]|nr:DEAD/DEAH box helicase [Candidatus Dormibacteraeota bacterium]
MARPLAARRQASYRAEFAASLPWPLDAFQEEAIDKLDAGAGVLVCAPTSSGKTVVAEYAIFRALAEGVQVIYTTPLKALSNQKFRDFQRVHGEGRVGLVTGENTINELAPIVVMTTEILRNVIYEDPQRLREVSYVILDEVHYIDDFPRGSVWEEIVIQAPDHIKLVGLSATIGNYRELADWMSQNRGRIDTVYTDRRPVELRLWLSIQNQFHPLFGPDGQVDQKTWAKASTQEEAAYRVQRFRSLPSNDLLHVVAELERQRMLPAIYFIFSRRGCREALQRCAYHSLDLTTDAQKDAIDAIAAERLASLKDPDEMALYNRMVDGDMLRRGLAVHHAGLLPFHKELVEELFAQGLTRVVFATETLSLGINMPARAVVVSSFTKFDGVNFSNLTTGELTQLMGRAGRRGIDTLGHGIISKEADVEIGTIYEVAMGEGLVIESKFLPNYNMVLNLLRIHSAEEAEKLMQRSFGQYQKLLAASQTKERLKNVRERLRDLEKVWECDHGCRIRDLAEYYRIEDRRRVIRIELRRLRRDAFPAGAPKGRTQGRGRGRGRRPQPIGPAGRAINRLDEEAKTLLDKQRKLKTVRCPHFGEHVAGYGEIHRLGAELASGEKEVTGQFDEYARKFRRLRQILVETAFLKGDEATSRGLLASRIYGENTLVVAEAVALNLFDGLTPEELCAVLVTLTAEDRMRDRGPRPPRRHPTPGIAQVTRLLRSIYFRFSDLERDLDEPNLRPPSHDYIDFAHRWASGEGLDHIPLPPNADIGDAIKAMKGLYSLLRQLEWALKEQKWPLESVVREATARMERDVIKRT